MSLIHSYRKPQLHLDKPKIVILEFDCSCDRIKALQEVIGIELTEIDILDSIITSLNNRVIYNLNIGLYLLELFEHLIIEDLFLKEIELLKLEYKIVTLKLLEQLTALGCYSGDTLPYHFASVVSEDALVLHRVTVKDLT